jgi:serine/threonine protein phosphatase 1
MNRFAISDIHGCSRTFLALLDRIAFSKADELYLLGDYVDRGPDSKGVFDAIFRMQSEGYTVRCLRGNHEQIVLRAQSDLTGLDNWLLSDGKVTADSFGVPSVQEIPQTYLDYMNGLEYYFEVEEYILVHAGLNFRLYDPLADTRDLLVIRHWHSEIRHDWLAGRVVVHGHTPVSRTDIEQQCRKLSSSPWLDIDAGCVYNSFDHRFERGFGHLCAFDMRERTVIFQENVESV